MANGTPAVSPRIYARVAGAAYLLIIIAGIFAEFFVRSNLIVAGDAAATANNIIASESLFRAGFVGDLVMLICDAVVALALYVLLAPVSRNIALFAMCFRLVHTGILGINLLNHFMALLLLGGADYLAVFDGAQLHALVLLFLNAHSYGYLIGQVFFGIHCALLGWLLFKSGYFPRFIGLLMGVASVGYLLESLVFFMFPSHESITPPGLIAAGVAELSLCLWLLLRGVDEQRWTSLLSESA